jgi:hypothetical protein
MLPVTTINQPKNNQKNREQRKPATATGDFKSINE